jgi:hypothetical protein
LAKQIVKLLTSADSFGEIDARHTAIYEKKLSDYELLFLSLCGSERRLKMSFGERNSFSAALVTPEREAAEARFKKLKDLASDIFIKAVLEGDKKTIIELADAAAFIKSKLDAGPADPLRTKLLEIRGQQRLVPRGRTIRQIAEQVYPANVIKEYAADGFSSLRRVCKQLGIRIKPSRKTSRK